jgi:hypothetical protein
MTNCMTTAPAVEVFRVSLLGQGSPTGPRRYRAARAGPVGVLTACPGCLGHPVHRVDATLPVKRATQKSVTLRSLDSGMGRHSAD